jgi:glycosyltransferase involved in cell wall biosynthesis
MGVSNASCNALRIMGATDAKLLHPSTDLSNIKVNPERVAALRQQLGIPADAFIWGSSGSLIYRKGIDYLPQLARRMKEQGRNCYFIWMGGETKNASEYYLRCELAHAGHTNVLFTGALSDTYYDHMALMDAFLMLSHEETFGMVNVEAAYLGKPILSFNNGGITDILQEGMGHIVQSWNVDDYANAMIAIMDGQIPFKAAIARQQALQFAPDLLYRQWDQYLSELP